MDPAGSCSSSDATCRRRINCGDTQPLRLAAPVARKKSPLLHPGIACNSCGLDIDTVSYGDGVRYICINCRDYNLCAFCARFSGVSYHYNNSHAFVKIGDSTSRLCAAFLTQLHRDASGEQIWCAFARICGGLCEVCNNCAEQDGRNCGCAKQAFLDKLCYNNHEEVCVTK